MTLWLLNQPIPRTVVVPTNPTMNAQTREVPVLGIGTIPYCPNCGRNGPIHALALGDGASWPNQVAICGRIGNEGCGIYWYLAPRPPHDLRLLD